MNKKFGIFASLMILLAFPLVSFAQAGFGELLSAAYGIISALIPIVIGLAVLAFLWGVFRYVVSSSDEDKTKARNFMIWGVLGLFVMVSVWGLVNLLGGTLDLDNTIPRSPGLPRG